MSKPSVPKSLLSAYFDDEVSAEERAAVSRATDKSPVVQRALDEYAELSKSLKSLSESAPAPDLREAVMAEIRSSQRSQPVPVPLATRSRRIAVASGGLAVAAAGLLLMVWTASPPQNTGNELALREPGQPEETLVVDGEESSSGERLRLDSSTATASLPGPLRAREAESHPDAGDTPVLAEHDADLDVFRTASIPEEWFTQQFAKAKDRRGPQPGDVMNYMLDVADETLVIPMTVVDVQRTAGQIRVLLADHGIHQLSEGESSSASSVDKTTVAILVESDWEQMPRVMNALDTQGLGVANFVESSPAAKRVIREQNALEPAAKVASSTAGLARDDALLPPAEPPTVAAREEPEAPRDPATDLTAVLRGMFFEAPVTDEFVEEIEHRQQAISEETHAPALADSAASERLPTDDAPTYRSTGPLQKFGVPLASEAPARVVFLIKKSGQVP